VEILPKYYPLSQTTKNYSKFLKLNQVGQNFCLILSVFNILQLKNIGTVCYTIPMKAWLFSKSGPKIQINQPKMQNLVKPGHTHTSKKKFLQNL